jgi:hypothetical protein
MKYSNCPFPVAMRQSWIGWPILWGGYSVLYGIAIVAVRCEFEFYVMWEMGDDAA